MGCREGSDFLIEALKDRDGNVRRLSCSAIGKLQLKSAVPFLIEVLQDPMPQVRQYAIKALSCIKDKTVIPYLDRIRTNKSEKAYNIRVAKIAIQLIKRHETDKPICHSELVSESQAF